MTQKLNIVLVGNGAIAGYVFNQISAVNTINIQAIICREYSQSRAAGLSDNNVPVFTSVEQLNHKPELLVDCAGHTGLVQHAPTALSRGIDVISISTGALTQTGLLDKLERTALAGNSSIRFLSGAVGGIDALTSAHASHMNEVTYTGRKPPGGWVGSPAENSCDLDNLDKPFEHFSGTARDAARLYPKNANVAATIALASIGLDHVMVKLIADPGIDKNIHEIDATGSFGKLSVRVEGNPLEGNPKSSALAAMSIVSELKRRTHSIRI